MKRAFFVFSVFLLILLISWFTLFRRTPQPPAPRPTTTKLDLWKKGTVLRGANLWQKVIDRKQDEGGLGPDVVGPPYSDASLKSLAALGANWVLLSHPGLFSEMAPYTVTGEVEAHLDALLDRIEKADLFVVLAFRTGPGRNEYDFDEGNSKSLHTVWTNPEEQAKWVSMWQHTARRYRSRKNIVGYEIMVEPNVETKFPKLSEPEKVWNTFAKQLVEAIRSEDPTTPILVSPIGFSNARFLDKLSVPENTGSIVSIHRYDPYEYTHQTATHRVAPPSERFTLPHRSLPIAITEFGVVRWASGALGFLEKELEYLDSVGVNSAVWLWESDWKLITYDEFNYRKGEDAKNHLDKIPNPLLSLLEKYWRKNTVRPSNWQRQ